ncbi:MAG: hypothetical protein P4L65_04665 [Legionella sp.]|nr:hypothetical protein [Legionella sp.]
MSATEADVAGKMSSSQKSDPERATTNPEKGQTPVVLNPNETVTETDLKKLREDLSNVIDKIHQNPSMIQGLTRSWDHLTWWEKIAGGVAVSGPTLAVGLIANIGILMAIGGVSAATYVVGGALLEDHAFHSKIMEENVKKGVMAISDTLIATIGELTSICQRLELLVLSYQKENQLLTENVNAFSIEVNGLVHQIASFRLTEEHLRTVQLKQEQTLKELQSAVVLDKILIEKNQTALNETKMAHAKCIDHLNIQIDRLTGAKTALEMDYEKAKNLATSLAQTITTLASAEVNTPNIQKWLNNLIKSEQEKAKEKVIKDITQITAKVKSALTEKLGCNEHIQEEQKKLIILLELSATKKTPANLLCTLGIMSNAPPKKKSDITNLCTANPLTI